MTLEFFHQQMVKVMLEFGEVNYTKGKVEEIWANTKDLPDYNFAQIVKYFIQHNKVNWPPTPSDFIEKAQEQRRLMLDRDSQAAISNINEVLSTGNLAVVRNIYSKIGTENFKDYLRKCPRDAEGNLIDPTVEKKIRRDWE